MLMLFLPGFCFILSLVRVSADNSESCEVAGGLANKTGAVVFGTQHFCYNLIQQNVSWATAYLACQSEGGTLLTIPNNDTQNEIVTHLTSASGVDNWNFWLGLYPFNPSQSDRYFTWINETAACSEVLSGELRVDCHPELDAKWDECTDRGCCWQEQIPKVDYPFCYKKNTGGADNCSEPVPGELREDCHPEPHADETKCHDRDCCWNGIPERNSGYPHCYYPSERTGQLPFTSWSNGKPPKAVGDAFGDRKSCVKMSYKDAWKWTCQDCEMVKNEINTGYICQFHRIPLTSTFGTPPPPPPRKTDSPAITSTTHGINNDTSTATDGSASTTRTSSISFVSKSTTPSGSPIASSASSLSNLNPMPTPPPATDAATTTGGSSSVSDSADLNAVTNSTTQRGKATEVSTESVSTNFSTVTTAKTLAGSSTEVSTENNSTNSHLTNASTAAGSSTEVSTVSASTDFGPMTNATTPAGDSAEVSTVITSTDLSPIANTSTTAGNSTEDSTVKTTTDLSPIANTSNSADNSTISTASVFTDFTTTNKTNSNTSSVDSSTPKGSTELRYTAHTKPSRSSPTQGGTSSAADTSTDAGGNKGSSGSQQGTQHHLSYGGLVGIVVAVVFLAVVAFAAIVYTVRRRHQASRNEQELKTNYCLMNSAYDPVDNNEDGFVNSMPQMDGTC